MTESNRIERLLAAILLQSMKGTTQKERAVQLNLVGFTSVEIANLLDTSAAVVSQHIYAAKKAKAKTK